MTTTADPTVCPACTRRPRRDGQLTCPACWRRIPAHLQADVNRTWRAYSRAASRGSDTFPEARDAYERARDAALASIA